jgi:hypothetical protein
MKIKIRIAAAFAFVALTIGLFSVSPSVSASRGCQKVKGNASAVNNGNGTASGTITQGGRLDGTTQTVFTSAFAATPDPTTFSFTDNLTLTTNKGVLQTHNVTLGDIANGVFTVIARIDPTASTGDFAGATGVLYINGKITDGGAAFQEEITGEICSAD